MQGYYIENRITKEMVKVIANSAQEACQKAGWFIGDCWVNELGVYPFQFRLEKEGCSSFLPDLTDGVF